MVIILILSYTRSARTVTSRHPMNLDLLNNFLLYGSKQLYKHPTKYKGAKSLDIEPKIISYSVGIFIN